MRSLIDENARSQREINACKANGSISEDLCSHVSDFLNKYMRIYLYLVERVESLTVDFSVRQK
jgi:hypothetical protein